MSTLVLVALLPIVLLIALGAALRQHGFVEAGFWPQAERLGYYVLLPCLFVHSLATAQLDSLPVGRLATTLILSTLAVSGLVMVLRPAMRLDGPAFTSVFQGSIRFNNYVGVTLAAGMFGAKGIALAAICNAAIVPTVNILSILVFARHGSVRLTGPCVAKQLVLNPLVVGSFTGVALQILGTGVPFGLESTLKSLGAASLPLGLVCVGAALDFSTARHWIGPVLSSSAMKFLVMPGVTLAVAVMLGLDGTALTAALVFQALPTASSAYIAARQMGGDAPLMAGITAVQNVLALAALPMVLIGLSALITV